MEKIYPQGAVDFFGHLGVYPSQNNEDLNPIAGTNPANLNLPVETEKTGLNGVLDDAADTDKIVGKTPKTPLKKTLKAVLPYTAVFVLAVLFYFIFFGGLSLSDMKTWVPKSNPQNQAQASQTPVASGQLSAYNAWINSYFFDVSDKKILDPNYDISGNGLTNYQKFLLGLNPKEKDTMGLGMTDTQALIAGIDPLTGGPLTSEQKSIIAQNIDLEAIANKLTLQSLDKTSAVAGISTTANQSDDRTDPVINLNQTIPGELDIPSLNISVPLIWAPDPNSVEKALLNGVVHYPGTPMPGQLGTSYISGHSSNYAWVKSPYNRIFASIDKMKMYDAFSITATDANGKKVIFHYAVRGTGIFAANDQKQFANIGKSTVALSTCWPIGTASKRYVVFGQLTQIEK